MAIKNTVEIIITASTRQLRAGMDKASKAVKTSADKMKSSFSGVGASLKRMSSGAKIALAAITAGMGLLIKETIRMGDESVKAERAFFQLVTKQGENATQIIDGLRKATRGLVDDTTLLQAANRALAFGIPSEKFNQLADSATQLATVMNVDVTQAFGRLITGLSRKSIPILDDLGFTTVEIRNGQERFAKSIGKTVSELNDLESITAIVDGAIEAADKKLKGIDQSTLTFGQNLQVLNASLKNLQAQIGKGLNVGLNAVIQSFQEVQGIRFDQTFSGVAEVIATQFVPFMAVATQAVILFLKPMTQATKVLASFLGALSAGNVKQALREINPVKVFLESSRNLNEMIKGFGKLGETLDQTQAKAKKAFDEVRKASGFIITDTGDLPLSEEEQSKRAREAISKSVLAIQDKINDLRKKGVVDEIELLTKQRELTIDLLQTISKDFPKAKEEIIALDTEQLDLLDRINQKTEQNAQKETAAKKKQMQELEKIAEDNLKNLERLEQEAEELREKREEEEKQRRLRADRFRADQGEAREDLARVGGTKGFFGKLFEKIMPGIASIDQLNKSLNEHRLEAEKALEIDREIAELLGEDFDPLPAKIRAVTEEIIALKSASTLSADQAKLLKEKTEELAALGIAKKEQEEQEKLEKKAQETAQEIQRFNEKMTTELRDNLASAFEEGIESGKFSFKKLGDFIKQQFIRQQIAIPLANAMLGLNQGATPGSINFGGGGALQIAQAGAGVAGGGLSGLFGGKGGLGGLFGKSQGGLFAGMSPLGLGLAAFSLFSSFRGEKAAPGLSGVQDIFSPETRTSQSDTSALFGSDIFQRASFSSRNVGGDVMRDFAKPRFQPEVTVRILPSKEFSAVADTKWVSSAVISNVAGVPKRTNFDFQRGVEQ